MDDLNPITRTERLLDGEDLTPTNREEMFIKRIYDKTQEIPEPVNRKEYFLKKAGEAGGDVTVVPLSVTDNGIYSEEGKAYSPVTVEVAPPEDSYQLKSITTPTSLATFEASEMPMPSLKVSVEAKQDLHGYDKPWVGGAGKNKYNKNNTNNQPNKRVSTSSGGTYTADGYTATYLVEVKPNTDYTLTTSSNFISYICWYDETQTRIGGTNWKSGTSKTSPSNAKYIRFDFSTADIDTVQLEQGSTATSFAPYSNICPISGWSEVNVSDVGKNLVNKDGTNTANGYVYGKYLYNNGEEATPSTPADWYISEYMRVEPNTTYTISGLPSSGANAPSIVLYSDKNASSVVMGYNYTNRTVFSFTTGATALYARVSIGTSFANTIQIEEGSTATTYEPYNPDSYTTTISLPQTVYGGEVDVVNGILKITDGYIASYNGETLPSTWISSMDVYAEGTSPTTGAEVCYELANPIIINLTPTLIKSLDGINNLSVDSGEVIEGEYFKALGGA